MDEVKIENSAAFLISEYNSLQLRVNIFEELKSKRVNFFLIVIAACGAIFSSILTSKLLLPYLLESLLIISAFCVILGFLILRTLINYSIAIVVFHRRCGRVRRWFVDTNKKIESYIAFEPNDDKPSYTTAQKYLHARGAEGIVLLVNSFMLSVFTGTLMHKFSIHIYIILSVSILLGGIYWYVQIAFTRMLLNRAETREYAKGLIHFPSEQ